MKITLLYLAVFLTILISGCDKDNDGSDSEILTVGSWRIGHYMDNSGDQTSDFLGYVFQFMSNGDLIATHNGVSKKGTWLKDASSNKLMIDLGADDIANQPLGELTDDWKISTFVSTEISLYDDNASSDMLVFLKN